MNLRQAFERVTKTKENEADHNHHFEENIRNIFKVDLHYDSSWWTDDRKEDRERLQGYWLNVWQCTDTWVGVSLWFLDNEPVFVVAQPARKSGCTIKFYDADAFEKMRVFIESFRLPPDEDDYQIADLETELDPWLHRDFADNVLHKRALFEPRQDGVAPRMVNISRIHYADREKFGVKYTGINPEILKIENGEEQVIDVALLWLEPLVDGITIQTRVGECPAFENPAKALEDKSDA